MFNNIDKTFKLSLTLLCWAAFAAIIILIFKYFFDLFAIIIISLMITYVLLWPINIIEKYLPDYKKVSKRLVSSVIVCTTAFIILAVTTLLLIKPVTVQMVDLSHSLPNDLVKLEQQSVEFINALSSQYNYKFLDNIIVNEAQDPASVDINNLPEVEKKRMQVEIIELKFLEQLEKLAEQGVPALPGMVFGTFRHVIYVILVLMLTLSFLLSEKTFHNWLRSFFIETHREKYTIIENKIHEALFGYIRGQTLMAIFSALFMWYVYFVFGLKYALILAILIGISQFVPILGPILAIAPALIIAMSHNLSSALFVLLIFLAFQAFKDNVIVPIVLGDLTGLNPVFIIIALVIGEKTAGILGVLIAVPVASIIKIFIANIWPELNLENNKELIDTQIANNGAKIQ